MSRRCVPRGRKRGAELRDRAAFAELLTAAGLSDRGLARLAKLGHATVNHLVAGRRQFCTIGTAEAIEDALGCERGALFEGVRG